MHTASFTNIDVRSFSFLKHNTFSTKAKELFIIAATRFFGLTFKNSHFRFIHKDNANRVEEVAEIWYC